MLRATVLVALFAVSCSNKEPMPPLPEGATEVKVSVDDKGYHPAEVGAPAGKPVRLVFTRTSDAGCGQQLAFPEQKIRKDLPLNEPVAVDLTMPASGKVRFTCGMAMYEGAVVVSP